MASSRFWAIITMTALLASNPFWAQAAQLPSDTPAQPPSVTPPPAPKTAQPVFPVLEFRIDGNTLLQRIVIERAVMPYLGPGRTIRDVEAARRNLEKVYHDRGYQTVLVNIPQQEVSSGIVRLTVLESPVGHLRINGSRYHSLQIIRATLPELQEKQVPDFNEVQKEITQVNRSQDLRVTPVLRASTTPGEVDVDLDVQDQLPLHGALELNNRYSAFTTHLRLDGELSYDNLFQRGQSLSLQYQVAPENPSDAEIWSASYVIPTSGGPVIALYGVGSNSNIATLGNLNVLGKGNIVGLRVIEPLPSSSSLFYHNLTGGIDYKDFKQNVQLQGAGVAASPARYWPVTLLYNATWLGAKAAAGKSPVPATLDGRSSTSLSLILSFLTNSLGDSTQFAVKRAGASPSYLTFRPGVQRQQVLPGGWSLYARADAQLASGPLISNEQYAAGGVDTVRGYTEAERLGDAGATGSIELRTPQLLAHNPHAQQSYLFLFADGSRLHIVDPLPGQEASFHLASAGVGLHFTYGGLTLYADGARALSAGEVTPVGSNSIQFSTRYVW
jgi:hemolysin activation/secretion protein